MENTNETVKNVAPKDEAKKRRNKWIGRGIIIGLFVLAIVIYFAVPSVHSSIGAIIEMFKSGDFDRMHDFIAKYGKWAMLVSTLLMIFQSIAAPLPAFFITLTNANLFGWWQGCILSWVSSMIGAVMCFYIARILGRDIVEKICTKGALLQIEEFFAKYGKKCILIARLLPFISFDVVSYAAGLTAMDFWGFFIATGVGQMPACIVYSYVGGMLTGGARLMFMGLVCLFALAILVIVIKQAFTASEKRKMEAAKAAGTEYKTEGINIARGVSKVYNTALWAMVVGLIAMRVPSLTAAWNVGWVFYGVWILALMITLLIRKLDFGVKFTLINTVASGILTFVLAGSAIMRKPAGLVRMGLCMSSVSLDVFNMILAAFVVVGLFLSIGLWTHKNKKKDD